MMTYIAIRKEFVSMRHHVSCVNMNINSSMRV